MGATRDQPLPKRPDPTPDRCRWLPHVHGAVGVGDESDGYAEAWFLPAAKTSRPDYATEGTWYNFFAAKAQAGYGATWGPGFATFQYPNSQPRFDHLVPRPRPGHDAPERVCRPGRFLHRPRRSGWGCAVIDSRTGTTAILPGSAAQRVRHIPTENVLLRDPHRLSRTAPSTRRLAVLPEFAGILRRRNRRCPGLYPRHRPLTDLEPRVLRQHDHGQRQHLAVPERRAACVIASASSTAASARFLILDFSHIPGVEVWQIGNEGGFLAAPVNITADHGNQLLMGLAERADVIVDFTHVPSGKYVLGNLGPDEPFGGGVPGVDFTPADPDIDRSDPAVPCDAGQGLRSDHSAPVPGAAGDHTAACRDRQPARWR